MAVIFSDASKLEVLSEGSCSLNLLATLIGENCAVAMVLISLCCSDVVEAGSPGY